MSLFFSILVFIPISYFIFITVFTWSSRNKKDGRLTLVMGKAGSGKSTYMGMLVKRANKRHMPVYSNHHVLGATKLEHTDLGRYNFHDCVIIIDEAQLHYDSRDFKSFSIENKFFFSNFRHFGIEIYILSQSFEDLDVKIRRQAQYMYICQPFIKGILYMQKIRMHFDVSEDETDIIVIYHKSIFGLRFHFAFLVWKYFDSFSMPTLEEYNSTITWGELPKNTIPSIKDIKGYIINKFHK